MDVKTVAEVTERLRVIGARVLVQRDAPKKMTESGMIHVPQSAQNPWREKLATVVAVGQGNKLRKDGTWEPWEFGPGDRVIVPVYDGTLVRVGDVDDLQVLDADKIEGILEED